MTDWAEQKAKETREFLFSLKYMDSNVLDRLLTDLIREAMKKGREEEK